jgi:hypothetical protein
LNTKTGVKKSKMEMQEDQDGEEEELIQFTIEEMKIQRQQVLVVKEIQERNEAKYSNMAQKLAQESNKDKKERTIEEMVPADYCKFLDVFNKKASERFPKLKRWDHKINLKELFVPKSAKTYPLFGKEREELDNWIKEQLKKGYIRPSKSPQASPFFFVGKKDGNLRPTQDYRYLNKQTIKDAFPLPLIQELVDCLKDAKYYSKLHLRWGYNNILIKDGDQWKAAFSTPLGLYEPLVMYFGLCNSPATFQRMMNELFEPLICQGVVAVYLDDILIYTKTEEEHIKTFKEVLKILQENNLFVKPEKCEFHKQEMEYLGLIIKPGEIAMDPVKVKGVMEWPVPKKVKQLQAFLGFCNYYRRFIEGFAQIARPLHELTKKDKLWEWTEIHQAAFEKLKNQFTKTPMLAMPNPDLPMRIECDASDYAYGAILSQLMEDNLWHPVAYISKSFNLTESDEVHDLDI